METADRFRELYIECDGMKVHAKLDLPAEQKERMPVLILFPGLTGHIEEVHIKAVKDTAVDCGYAVLRAELYGHGLSDGRLQDHDVLIWMHQAMRVIDYAAMLPFADGIVVSGHSQGGLTAVLSAGLMADKVKALMPLSPAINIWDGARKGELFGYSFDTKHIPEIYPKYGNLSGNYLRAAAMLPVEAAVERFSGPVLIVHGRKDEAVDHHYAKWLKDQYRQARLITVEDGHQYENCLDEVLAAARIFLTEISDITS